MDNTTQQLLEEAQHHIDTKTHEGVQHVLRQISLTRHIALDDPMDLVQPGPTNTIDVTVEALMTRGSVERIANDENGMLDTVHGHLGFLASAIEESVILDALSQVPAQTRMDPRAVLDDMMNKPLSMHVLDHIIWSRIVSAEAFTNEFIPNPRMLSGEPNVLDFMTSPGHFRFGTAEPAVIFTDAFRHPMLRTIPSNTWFMVEAFPCFYHVYDAPEKPVIYQANDAALEGSPFQNAKASGQDVFTLLYRYKIAIDLPTDIKVHRTTLT